MKRGNPLAAALLAALANPDQQGRQAPSAPARSCDPLPEPSRAKAVADAIAAAEAKRQRKAAARLARSAPPGEPTPNQEDAP